MKEKQPPSIEHRTVELDGVVYVILRETAFDALCRKAGVDPQIVADGGQSLTVGADLDRASLAAKLVRRRRIAGLSQAELARLAGVRGETLNRIERGKTTPDFATIRKLIVAMDAAERGSAASGNATSSQKETKDVDQQ
ncbi:MAG: helix-turn-helix domain-containing protein [Planctomycetaceae bacterium]|nr:helix-turn-helix domain-containing protein [Planctomycetaceae bacterium]